MNKLHSSQLYVASLSFRYHRLEKRCFTISITIYSNLFWYEIQNALRIPPLQTRLNQTEKI